MKRLSQSPINYWHWHYQNNFGILSNLGYLCWEKKKKTYTAWYSSTHNHGVLTWLNSKTFVFFFINNIHTSTHTYILYIYDLLARLLIVLVGMHAVTTLFACIVYSLFSWLLDSIEKSCHLASYHRSINDRTFVCLNGFSGRMINSPPK